MLLIYTFCFGVCYLYGPIDALLYLNLVVLTLMPIRSQIMLT